VEDELLVRRVEPEPRRQRRRRRTVPVRRRHDRSPAKYSTPAAAQFS
jgi:hypothetical protein